MANLQRRQKGVIDRLGVGAARFAAAGLALLCVASPARAAPDPRVEPWQTASLVQPRLVIVAGGRDAARANDAAVELASLAPFGARPTAVIATAPLLPAPVPEPALPVLLGSVLLGLGLFLRRGSAGQLRRSLSATLQPPSR